MKRILGIIALLAVGLLGGLKSAMAEEGGRGHTWAGDKASLAGTLPSETGTTFRLKMMFYDGNLEKEKKISKLI